MLGIAPVELTRFLALITLIGLAMFAFGWWNSDQLASAESRKGILGTHLWKAKDRGGKLARNGLLIFIVGAILSVVL